jgi:hypothetical protein
MKKVAIIQSSYIPWKGYFDMIRNVDLFIFHDDLQYTKGDWRNRNKIKTPNGPKWLTIPCGTNEKRLICEVELKDAGWQKKHWRIIQECYRNALFYRTYKPFFEEIYLGTVWKNLSEFNQNFIKRITLEILGAKTTFVDSRVFQVRSSKAERVCELLKKAGAVHYISGPSAKNYLSEDDLAKKGISLKWMDYSGYPEYNQLYPPFEHHVSIIDLIMNEGPNAVEYMKTFNLEDMI